MTIQQTIEKAIEGGYNPGFTNDLPWYVKKLEHGLTAEESRVFLDPLFWQYLGKAMGWKGMKTPLQEYSRTGERMFQDTTRYHWHRFIDHLAEGKDAESFFANI